MTDTKITKNARTSSSVDELKTGLLKSPTAIYGVLDDPDEQDGRISIKANDTSGGTFFHNVVTTEATLRHLKQLAKLADKASLNEHQSPKKHRELSILVRQTMMTLGILEWRDGFYRAQHGGEVIDFFVLRGIAYHFGHKKSNIPLRTTLFPPKLQCQSQPPQPTRAVKKKERVSPPPDPDLYGRKNKAAPTAPPASPVPTKKKVVRTLANVKAKADHSTVEREHLEAIDLDDSDNDDYGRFPDVDFGSDRND